MSAFTNSGYHQSQDHQVTFLESIRNQFLTAEDGLERIGHVLRVEKSALYNRLSGKKRLSVDEVLLLSRHFGVAYPGITTLELPPGTVSVSLPALAGQPHSGLDYLAPLLSQLHRLRQLPLVILHYITAEIPLFDYLHYPSLASFKFYVWRYFTWGDKGRNGKPHPFQTIIPSTEESEMYARVRAGYDGLPSTEVWHVNILDNTLNPMVYLESVGLISRSDVKGLLDQVDQLLERVNLRAERGHKSDQVTFELYLNEVNHTNNLVIVEAGDQSAVFFAYDNPNLCQSQDPALVAYTREAFHRFVRNCTSLSHGSDRQRKQFFNQLHNRVEQVRLKM
ncbi:MAG: hypothetical protein R2787_06250 [Saprospiraceae bacterium]